jgi:uncharacterized protein YqhQ
VTAVRRPDGEIVTETTPLNPFYTGKLRKIPFVRGVVALIESMLLGIKTLVFSANIALSENGEKAVQLSGPKLWLLLGISLAISAGLFFLIPLLFTDLFTVLKELSPLAFNLVEGAIRLAIFVGYILLISRMPDIRRLFAYHGAEHKTINAMEAGASLDVDSVKKYSTAHIRCGTSFLFAVMVIAILVFSIVGRPALYFMVLARLGLIPVIAGISYELTFFGARHCNSPIVRAVLTPGLLLQKLTTREPDDSQLEVAIAALKQAIAVDAPVAAAEIPATAPATLVPNAVHSEEI